MLKYAFLALALAGCGHKTGTTSQDAGGAGTGCLQGVVVDGLTAARVPVPSGSGDVGVFALVRGNLLPASPAADAASDPMLVGEYTLCGIPVDEAFPLLAWLDGYLTFEGQVIVHSTAASRSQDAKADLPLGDPISLANIRVYPKNQQVKDLTVVVAYAGAPLAGAQVILRPVGTNFLDPTGLSFVPPTLIRQGALNGTSGADGTVVFHAADLVLGAHYTYTVIPPNGGVTQTAVAAASFIVGLRDGKDNTDPYLIDVDLSRSQVDLAVLSTSLDAGNPDPTGTLTVYFNRDIEIVPGTLDDEIATLSGNVTAQLVPDVPTNKQPDQMKVTINANVLTLAPVFKTKPDADPTKELDLAITYSGVQVRPKAAPGTLSTLTVANTVPFYK